MIVAALMPLSLSKALERLPELTERFEPPQAEIEQRQIPRFRAAAKVRRSLGC